ncbi:EamA family transporter [Qipengyuania sp. XHP0207]|uniref:EamA family transporter n=1 Tax=Qipengyuania sp. XHP0207 TaxID=3038078 RepID=UPI00241FD4D5|nr:EamA family transporter [Qipengyuania sp. XHP0207]MDG5749167.1 EamA family transporter [Qipengyuania sp. XHP0207]
MSPVIVTLLLASAMIHAGWNAHVKSGTDRLWSISIISLFGAIAALPFAALLQPPALVSLPYILLSSLLQVGYCLFLVRAYDHGDLAQVYPIARGSAPLLVTIGAAIFAGELPHTIGLVGILLVSVGIFSLAVGRYRTHTKSLVSAIAAGAFIASYMVVDGLGVRASGSPTGYASWQAAFAGFLIPLAFIVIRRKAPVIPTGKEGASLIFAGVLSALAYCVAVWAMSDAKMGAVSALRETSILFAALFSALALREKMTPGKLIGAVSVTAGVVCFAIS